MDSIIPVQVTLNKINFSIDPRIELLASIQLISDYGDFVPVIIKKDFTYKKKMKAYFEPFKEHQAVKLFEKLSKEGLAYDAPHNLMIQLTNPPLIEPKEEISEDALSRVKTPDEIYEFIKLLKEYAIDTEFNKFYDDNREFYKTMIENSINGIKEIDFLGQIESYYNMSQNSYNFIFTPALYHGYGPRIKRGEKYDIYSIVGTDNIIDDIPKFEDISYFKYMIWHEFSHSFINPITDKHINEVNKYENLFEPIKDKMEKQGYSKWSTCVNEHIIRALTTRFYYIYDGKQAGDSALEKELILGFIYVKDLCEKLKRYENNREKYKDFKEFYLELISVFKEV